MSTSSRHPYPPPAPGPSPAPPPPPPQSERTSQQHPPLTPRVPRVPARPRRTPCARHGARSPSPPPHPPARLRRDTEPPPQQGKPAGGRPPGLSRSGSGTSHGSPPLRAVPPPASPRTEPAGRPGAFRATSAPPPMKGLPTRVCAWECDARVVLVPPHLSIPLWDKRRRNLFIILFGFSSPEQEPR